MYVVCYFVLSVVILSGALLRNILLEVILEGDAAYMKLSLQKPSWGTKLQETDTLLVARQ